MKKKLLITLLASACAVGCAAGLAACNSGDSGDGGEKHLTGFFVSVSSNEHATYDMGKFVYGGAAPDFDSLKLYAKYSDNSSAEIKKTDGSLTTTYTYNGAEISQLPAAYNVGEYYVNYSYSEDGANQSASVSFEVVPSATASPFTVELEKTTWTYLEDLPTATVKEGTTALDSENYTLKYISETKYNEIKNDADFAEKLNTETENNYFSGDVAPGSYYVFAMAGPSQKYNSQFVKVTVNKADVTPSKTSGFAVTYNYDGNKIGNIKLFDVSLDSLDVTFKDSNENNVNGSLVWDTPETTLNSSNSGVTKVAKFVPEAADYYNEYELPEPVTLTINKGVVYTPSLYGGATTWDGNSHEIKITFTYSSYNVTPYADITRGGAPITVSGEGNDIIDTQTEIGDYVYTFSLKDKTNYYWEGANDATDKVLTYSIVGKEPWVGIGNASVATLDAENKFKLLITGDDQYGGEEPYVYLTPYEAGTLNVEVVTDNTAQVNGSTYYQEIVGSAEIIEESGKTYLVITVDNFKDKVQDNQATLLRFTATGADHYADIDTVNGSLNLNAYVAPSEG